MVNRLPIGAGIDSIPTDTIPSDPKEFVDWFKGVGVKRWFGPADVRNVLHGSGIEVTNNGFNTPPTIGISASFQGLLDQPYVLLGSPVESTALTDFRSIAVQNSVLSLADAGAQGSLTIGVVNNGIGNAQLRQGAPFSVIGNDTNATANVQDLTQAQLTSMVNLATAALAGAIPALSGHLTDYLSGTGVFTALPTVPTVANPSASIGLTTVNGASGHFMDAASAPKLDQAISPTMTGNWVFTPASGVAITVNGPSGVASVGIISANSATAVIADLFVWRAAGTANAMNQGPSFTVLETVAQVGGTLQASGGQIELWQITGAGPAGRQIFKVTTVGGIVVNAPASGTTLSLPDTLSATCWTGGLARLGVGIAFAGGQSELITVSTTPLGIGTAGAAALNLYTNSINRLAISSAGAATFSGSMAVNGGTPTAAPTGYGTPSGAVTASITGASTLAQVAATFGAFLAYMKTLGFVAA